MSGVDIAALAEALANFDRWAEDDRHTLRFEAIEEVAAAAWMVLDSPMGYWCEEHKAAGPYFVGGPKPRICYPMLFDAVSPIYECRMVRVRFVPVEGRER